ncbi:hypothetical protein [Pseudodesulfovibrio profundus]|nr:hypothetical protein [Pseudodesulfovibrio profundus]
MLRPQVFTPTQGVNYGNAPIDLKSTELSRSMNGYYPKQSSRWTVRPGFECVTDAVNKLTTPILGLTPYYNGTTLYLVAFSGGKIYAMSKAILESSTPAWTEIGFLSDSTTKPQAVVYNGLLLIADGGPSIRYWDGTTTGLIANSPSKCTALAEARGVLIGNSGDVVDYIYLSAPNFADKDWQSGSGHREVAVGFGDGVPVNAFCVGPGGKDVLVSKKDDRQGVGQIRRLIMPGADTLSWYVSEPTDSSSAAQNAHGMLNAFGRTFYFDDTGMRAVAATDGYDEVNVDAHFGKRINKAFNLFNAVVQEITFLPTIGAFMLLLQSYTQPYLYFPRNNAFCPWRMSGAIINSACTIDNNIYMGTADGNLYRMNENIGADEVEPGVDPKPIQSYGRTKKVTANGYDMVLKRTTLAMTPIRSGTVYLRAVKNNEATQVQLCDGFPVEDGRNLLGLATGLLGLATGLLGAGGAEPTQQTIHGGIRDCGLQIEWYGDGARYEIEQITAEIAGPLGE